MIPVDQTRVHDPDNGVIGNCWRACVASLLECGIDDMPPFEEANNPGKMEMDSRRWLLGRGLVFMLASSRPFPGYYMAVGSCDRFDPDVALHCVVYLGEDMVHDPNPAKAGLTEVWDRLVLVPLNPGVVGINSRGLSAMVGLLQSIANGKGMD